jgi:hypothetical protein
MGSWAPYWWIIAEVVAAAAALLIYRLVIDLDLPSRTRSEAQFGTIFGLITQNPLILQP